jgi:hypothetical protein
VPDLAEKSLTIPSSVADDDSGGDGVEDLEPVARK